MDPVGNLCPKCGRFFPSGHSCPWNECNEDSTLFLDEVAKERKPHDESDDKSTNIESDFTTYDIDGFQCDFLDQTEDELDSSQLRFLEQDPLISEGNPMSSSTSTEGSFMEVNQEDFEDDSFENVPEFLITLEPPVTDDANVSDQGNDKIDKTTDSCEKTSESSEADLAKAMREFRIESTSGKYCGGADLSLLQESNELQSTSQGSSLAVPSCSHAGPSTSDHCGYCKPKPQKSTSKHSPKGKFLCRKCGRKRSRAKSHKRHQSVHTGKKSFDCKDCARSYSNSYDLKIHNRSHTGELLFPCILCPKKFRTKSQLKVHFRKHTGEQPFVCLRCGRKYS